MPKRSNHEAYENFRQAQKSGRRMENTPTVKREIQSVARR